MLFFLMRKKIIKPIEILVKQSEAIAKKELDQPFLWIQHDEMGQLGHSLELTRVSLRSAFRELEESNGQLQLEIGERMAVEKQLYEHREVLEKKIQERTQELQRANDNLKKEIGERQKAEEDRRQISLKLHRAEKMEALGMLASSVAHDLNNILAGIVSYPELLLLRLDKESDMRRPLIEIMGAGKRATEVVADLLTVARSTTTHLAPEDLARLVDEYLSSPEYRHLLSNHPGIKIDVRFHADDPIILCSIIHVKKCVMNLMTNAVEASGTSGSIVVEISNVFESQLMDGGRMVEQPLVVLSVRDTGSGIQDSDLEHIFEPFYSTKQMGMSGSGLGLAIVWNTMQDHNGKVTVESDVDGTCFKLYFPSTAQRVQEKLENEDVVEDYKGNGERILVVDDEPLLMDIGYDMLCELGYLVTKVRSGEEAVAYVATNHVDAVVLDMVMEPGINGLETYQQILKIHPKQKAMLVSGFAMNDDIRAALDLGVSTFLKKPYTMRQFGEALQFTLHSKTDENSSLTH